jgi:cation diffusion facilitator family transporter
LKILADKLAEKLTTDKDLRKPEERYRIGLIESWFSIGGNLLIALLKAFFGLLTNSIALIADAVHSASDIFSSLVVLAGFSLAKRKPDQEHPHGHGRIEYLAGLLIALMLFGAGIAFIYNSYIRLTEGITAQPSIAAIAVVLASIFAKEFMFRFSDRLGRMIDSTALAGDAWHHRSDSLSSVLVLVALVGGYFGFKTLDAYLGFGVALFIIYAGAKIALQSCSSLLGKAPEVELQREINDCAMAVDGVIDAHDLEIHDYGSWKVVTVHIGVNGRLSLDEAHVIAHRVEYRISSCFHCDAVVHLDPR